MRAHDLTALVLQDSGLPQLGGLGASAPASIPEGGREAGGELAVLGAPTTTVDCASGEREMGNRTKTPAQPSAAQVFIGRMINIK